MKSAGSAARRPASAPSKRKQLQIRNIEWLREQIFQLVDFGFSVRVKQHDFDIAAKFPQDLAAGPAGRRELVRIGCHRNAPECADARAFGDDLKDGDALGT